MKFEDRRKWGHWALQPSGIQTLGYYREKAKTSMYGCPLFIFRNTECREMNFNHYGRKAYMSEQDGKDLRTAINDLLNDGTIEKEWNKHKEG